MSRSASQTPNLTRKNLSKSNQGVVGAVDEDFFYNHFASVESREISNARELQEITGEIIIGLKGHSEDWEKRVKALKTLQSISLSGSSFDEFISPCLRQLQVPLQSCLSDLRSQVVREACLAVAYLTHVLKIRAEIITDAFMSTLIGLIPNSARIMATSGMVCLSIIVTNIHSPKILLHVSSAMNSKSNSTRRFASKLLEIICSSWDSTVLEKQLHNLQNALEKGMADADQEARAVSRSAFIAFVLNFPQEAHKMMMLMDSGRRTLLEKELSNHPAGEILEQFNSATKQRTTCPPTTLKLGTSSYANRTPKKNSVSDSGDEANTGKSKSNYSSLTRSKIKTQTDRTNIMTSSVTRNSESSNLRGSNSSLTGYTYKSSARTTPQTTRRSSSGNAPILTLNNGSIPTKTDTYSSYKYKTTGSVSASLPRRKNLTSNNKGLYSGFENGMDPPTSGLLTRRRLDSSDDNGSETSSIESSEVSRSSLRAIKPSENTQEILRQLSSAHWSEKKDGLINFQNIIQNKKVNITDLKRYVEVLNTIFNDTKSKIFPLFLVCIQQLIENHKQYLYDWLYPLLLNLISKQASETLSSRQKPIQETLNTIRSHFPLEIQIRDCCRVITDSYQNTSMKFKLSIMAFFKTVVIVAPSNVLEQSIGSLAPTVNIIVEWIFESKWQEIRKISNGLLLKFHSLHPQILDAISNCLPPTTKQKILNLIKTSTDGDTNSRLKMRNKISRSNSFHDKNSDKTSTKSFDKYGYYGHSAKQRDMYANRNKPQIKQISSSANSMTQEDIDNYIRRNTEDLQALAVAYERYDGTDGNRSYSRTRPYNSQLRTQLSDPPYGDINTNENHINHNMLSNSTASYMINRFQSSLRNTDYPPSAISNSSDMLQDSFSGHNRNALSGIDNSLAYSCYPNYDPGAYNYYPVNDNGSTLSDQMLMKINSSDAYLQSQSPMGFQMLRKISDLPPNDMIMTILAELCYLNQRTEQRKACLMKLINLVRENCVENWNEVFKTTLMRLLDTVKDTDPEIRTLSLRVLQELTKIMPQRFDDFTHLTVLKILHCHKDSDKTVVRAAEECSQIMARCLSQNLCIKVLSEVLNDNDCRVNLGALKMLLEVLKNVPESLLLSSLDSMIPGLIRTSEHEESHIRKASIFCLVEINKRIGDNIWTYLTSLSSSKARLLRLYIEKNNSCRMTESNYAT